MKEEDKTWSEAILYAINYLDNNPWVSQNNSKRYDVLYNSKFYPPKLVYSYAADYLEAKFPDLHIPNPGGGKQTNNIIKKYGFKVIPKSISMINEFINWLVENPRHNYFDNDKGRLKEALDHFNSFFKIDIYDGSDIKQLKRFIQNELYDKASSEFLDYSLKTSNHLPRAILGNKNYIKFLNEKNQKFKINDDIKSYSWVKTHLELADYLKDYKTKQLQLLELLKSAGVTEFTDRDKDNQDIDLAEIDPFTFFCYIYKYGDQRRLQILQFIAKTLNLHYPEDEKGIPSSNAQKVWLFPFKSLRVNNEIERLWTFFNSIFDDTITNETFADILTIRGIARTKLTEALFNVNPKKYFPINGPTKPYLKEVYGINPKFKTFDDYRYILSQLELETNKPFYQLSYEAWLWNESKNAKLEKSISNIKYWLYAPGRNAEHWDEFYNNGIIAIGWDKIGDLTQHKSKNDIFNALKANYGGEGDKKNNVTANYEFCNQMQIGDIVIVKRGRGELLGYGEVTSEYYHNKDRTGYKSCRKVDWKLKGNWKTDFSLVLKTLTDVTAYKSKKADYEFYYQNLIGIMSENLNTSTLIISNAISTNKIFYGSPGTGKTFYLKDQLFDQYTIRETSISQEKFFEETVSELTWWQVLVLALIEIGTARVNTILENRWVMKKANLSESKNVRATLWGTLQMHTIIESKNVAYTQRQAPFVFDKNSDKSWSLLESELKEQAPELYEILDRVNNFKANPDTIIKNYSFVTFHQSFAYEDFIEGIKPILPETESEEVKDLGYTIEDGVFKLLCTKAKNDPDNRYAIFIDEINRGNVSAIFGELITLIEIDKRRGAKNELSIKLPYSKKEFSVPSNLDIYGTMNTADRSVESLDTALRRRFEFKEMMPDLDVIEDEEVDRISLSDVLRTINQRIELLIDRDHTIGHSYFVNVNTAQKLADSFNNKIVPLLQEYFYGDYGKIGLVLGKGFVEKIKNERIDFAAFDYENSNDFKTATFALNLVDSNSIIDAISLLLGKTDIQEV